MKKKSPVLLLAIGLYALVLLQSPSAATAQIDPNAWYQVIVQHSGQCLDVLGATSANGLDLGQHPCHAGDNQKFQFRPLSSGFYRIVAGHSNKCVDQHGANFIDGGRIVQFDCHDGFNQQWTVIPDGAGFNFIQVRHSGKVMDVAGASFAIAAKVIQHSQHGFGNQRWRLQVTTPPNPCPDNDGDGFCGANDCNDNDPSTFPGAPLDCFFGADQNCNGFNDFNEPECSGGPEQ
jgi:Ricin-type beta-trefoil lectin domain